MPSRFASGFRGLMGSRGHSNLSQSGVSATPAAAMGQNTAASQLVTAQAMTRSPFGGGWRAAPKRRKSRRAAASAPKRRKSSGKRKPARLVKGSAAAKRYMASIRRKRRR